MKGIKYILKKVELLPKGYLFTYEQLLDTPMEREAVIKSLNRLVATGEIKKYSKGRFYAPEISPFGPLKPSESEIIKDLLEDEGEVVGYLTGIEIYRRLGLTTQMSNTIQIGKNQVRPKFKRGKLQISIIEQKNKITRQNIPFLQLLDAIRYINKISDRSIERACERIMEILKKFTDIDIQELIMLALNYPPSTRAKLGAMLEIVWKKNETAMLLASLNPISSFKFDVSSELLKTKQKWQLI